MPTEHHHAGSHLERLLRNSCPEELARRLAPHTDAPAPPVPGGAHLSEEIVGQRWKLLPAGDATRDLLLDAQTRELMAGYRKNIENFIGTVKVPVGLAGPLRVNGLFARGDYYVPLATTEAALVASYSRGAQVISEAGGCASVLLNEGISRAPGFKFNDIRESGLFIHWATGQFDELRRQAESTTRHGKLVNLRFAVEGNHVFLVFEFTTGDASGQNMVTLATQAACDYILANSPVKPQQFFIEANLSGDKKASALSFTQVRGKKACAEAVLPAGVVQKRLRTTPQALADHWRMSVIGGVLSGAMGLQGHYANGLAALYLACGQDVACVAESAVGVTRFEATASGDLYASVTLPSIMVGTVGGGAGLPSQRACLDILGLSGENRAQALAEIAAALCLAGELSIAGALTSGDFSRAHRLLARGKAAKGGRE